MSTKGTPQTQVRLSDAERAKAEEIRVRWGLPSMAAAIRYSIERVHREDQAGAGKPRKIKA